MIVDELRSDFSDYSLSFLIFDGWPKDGSLVSDYYEVFFDRLGRLSNFLLFEF